jgi:hypothetical protein
MIVELKKIVAVNNPDSISEVKIADRDRQIFVEFIYTYGDVVLVLFPVDKFVIQSIIKYSYSIRNGNRVVLRLLVNIDDFLALSAFDIMYTDYLFYSIKKFNFLRCNSRITYIKMNTSEGYLYPYQTFFIEKIIDMENKIVNNENLVRVPRKGVFISNGVYYDTEAKKITTDHLENTELVEKIGTTLFLPSGLGKTTIAANVVARNPSIYGSTLIVCSIDNLLQYKEIFKKLKIKTFELRSKKKLENTDVETINKSAVVLMVDKIYNSYFQKYSSARILATSCGRLIIDTNITILGTQTFNYKTILRLVDIESSDNNVDFCRDQRYINYLYPDNIQDILSELHSNKIFDIKYELDPKDDYLLKLFKKIKNFDEEKYKIDSKLYCMLNSLPYSIKNNKQINASSKECPICYEEKELVIATECKHIFCFECITTNLSISNNCPCCRASISMKDISIIDDDFDNTADFRDGILDKLIASMLKDSSNKKIIIIDIADIIELTESLKFIGFHIILNPCKTDTKKILKNSHNPIVMIFTINAYKNIKKFYFDTSIFIAARQNKNIISTTVKQRTCSKVPLTFYTFST